MCRLLMTIGVLMLALPALAIEKVTEHTVKLSENEEAGKASINDMSWLAGRWTGDGLGGRTVETWSEPQAGVMLGTFHLIREGKTVFYEFLTLGEGPNGFSMRLKHFNPDLTAWEEKEKVVEFRYVRTEGNLVQFGGLTFRRDSEEALTIFLALRGKDGTVREETFTMLRGRVTHVTR
jgi:hypothetical protein